MAYKKFINDMDNEVIVSELEGKYTLNMSKDAATFVLDVLQKRLATLQDSIKNHERRQNEILESKNVKIENWREKFEKSIEDILNENCNDYGDVEDIQYGCISGRFDTVAPNDDFSLDDISALMRKSVAKQEKAECDELIGVIAKLSPILRK